MPRIFFFFFKRFADIFFSFLSFFIFLDKLVVKSHALKPRVRFSYFPASTIFEEANCSEPPSSSERRLFHGPNTLVIESV